MYYTLVYICIIKPGQWCNGKKIRKMEREQIKSRNLFSVLNALEAAGETGVGYKDSPAISIAIVWNNGNTGRFTEICEAHNKNLIPRAPL